MIKSVAGTIRDTILDEIKTAYMYSLVLNSTTDVAWAKAKLDQFAFLFRYCSSEGTVHERFLCTDETADSTGNVMLLYFAKFVIVIHCTGKNN